MRSGLERLLRQNLQENSRESREQCVEDIGVWGVKKLKRIKPDLIKQRIAVTHELLLQTPNLMKVHG
jgi:hypothetical protein